MNYFYNRTKCTVYLLGITLLLISCSSAEKPKNSRPNILLIVSEDNSPDLGCYGNDIVHTPNLDRLAENGVRFANAYTTYSVCSPSRSSIFTGLYPHQNGQLGWATLHYSMYEGIKVLPQYLKGSGYNTGILGKIHVKPGDIFSFDYSGIPGSNFKKENLSLYAQKAKEFVQKSNAEDKPYMLMVNFPDAHLPFQNEVEGLPTVKVNTNRITSSLPFVGVNTSRLRKVTEAYYNCMNRLDESIGMLLDSIDDLSNTCIIYLSDHGAQFGRGKMTNYEGGLKIPFIVHWPEMITNKGEVYHELVSVVDILPTILEISGTKIPKNLPGLSLLDLLSANNNSKTWREFLCADGEGASPLQYFPMRSIRNEKYKLILNIDVGREKSPSYTYYSDTDQPHGANTNEILASEDIIQNAYETWESPPKWELYDLENDPWEFENLSENQEYQEPLTALQDALQKWRDQTNDPFLDKNKLDAFTNEMDSINLLYPDYGFRNIADFKWEYLEYLNK